MIDSATSSGIAEQVAPVSNSAMTSKPPNRSSVCAQYPGGRLVSLTSNSPPSSSSNVSMLSTSLESADVKRLARESKPEAAEAQTLSSPSPGVRNWSKLALVLSPFSLA